MTTPNLQLPEVPEAIQNASDELNDGFWTIDAILQLAVQSRTVTAPPAGAQQGQRWIVPVVGATGAWINRSRHVAVRTASGWDFKVPRPGWCAWVIDESLTQVVYDGTEWQRFAHVPAGGSAGEVLSKASGSDYDLAWSPASSDTFYNKQWVSLQNAISAVGASAPSTVGTQSSPAKATTNFNAYIAKRRITSGTTANQTATYNSANTQDECYLNASVARAAGFKIVMRFGLPSVIAGERFWCGLNGPSTGSNNPGTLTQLIGIGRDDTDTNVQFMHNDGSGTATKINLGRTFASLSGHAFDLILSVPVGGGSCSYQFIDLDDSTTYSGNVTTNLPTADTALNWNLWASVGATGGTAVAVDLMYVLLRYPLV